MADITKKDHWRQKDFSLHLKVYELRNGLRAGSESA